MPKLDRYLLSELAQSVLATLVVLLIVCLGGVFVDVLTDITRGRVPPGMMLMQFGLVLLQWLPRIVRLALMLGLMLGMARLYRDSEMPVLASIGVGPRRMLKPLMLVVLPLVAVVAACSLWLAPWAERVSKQMINEANRSLLVAGLEPGRFTELPAGSGQGGVIYIGSMSNDGSRFSRVFVYRQTEDRRVVTTSDDGQLSVDANGDRYLSLSKGFEVEGPRAAGLDYNLLRYARNDVLLPAVERKYDPNSPELMPTTRLFGDSRREANAQLHYRIAPPLLAIAFALMAVPLARSSPREARYGHMLMGFLAYLIGMNLMLAGQGWLEDGKIAAVLGLWWLVLPTLAIGLWVYFSDGRLRRRKGWL